MLKINTLIIIVYFPIKRRNEKAAYNFNITVLFTITLFIRKKYIFYHFSFSK